MSKKFIKVKMPPSNNECVFCGSSDITVETRCEEPNHFNDGDEVVCDDCNATGMICCDEDDLWITWDEED